MNHIDPKSNDRVRELPEERRRYLGPVRSPVDGEDDSVGATIAEVPDKIVDDLQSPGIGADL